jgi:hypothetical protein
MLANNRGAGMILQKGVFMTEQPRKSLETIPLHTTVRDAAWDASMGAGFIYGAVKSAHAAWNAIRNGSPVEAAGWSMLGVMGAFMAATSVMAGIDVVRTDNAHNLGVEQAAGPQR